MRQISASKLRGIRDEKGFARSRRNPNKIFPANVYPVFQFQLSDAASSPEFFLYFLLFPLSFYLSISHHSGTESEVWNSNTRESFAKNNVVPCCIVGQVSMVENSWYSFVTWPPPFHRIRPPTEFPGNNRLESRRQLFSGILSFRGRKKFGRYTNLGYWDRIEEIFIFLNECSSRCRNCFDYCFVLQLS